MAPTGTGSPSTIRTGRSTTESRRLERDRYPMVNGSKTHSQDCLSRYIYRIGAGALLSLLAFINASAEPSGKKHAAEQSPEGAWYAVTVGVADLNAALDVWVEMMGFEVRTQREGPDEGLAALWQIDPADVERQAVVGTPGAVNGFIHLVQFRDPEPPVRQGAEVFDLLPKNLDVFVQDLPRRFEELRTAGADFRTDSYSEVETPSGSMFREIHMHGHDATNIVFVETSGAQDLLYTRKGYSGIRQLITIVPDADEEERFFTRVMAMDYRSKNFLEGPSVEKMVGLPPGTALDIRILGNRAADFGLMEIVEYQGVEGSDRYALARPKALGTLHVSYLVIDLAPLKERLRAYGSDFSEHDPVETLFGRGPAISFYSPAGLRIEAHQRR